MNAASILAIPADQPERLFHPNTLQRDFRALAFAWHPDRCVHPQASDVFAHIGKLHAEAKARVRKGLWATSNSLTVLGKDGKKRSLSFRLRSPFELGEVMIGSVLTSFLINATHEPLVMAGLKAIGDIRYPNDKFRKSLDLFMPHVARSVETATQWLLTMRKDPDEMRISDLARYLGGSIEPKHVAWIVSSLLNLACFLEVSDMTLNGMTVDTVYVNPRRHTAALYGGWWYAAKSGRLITHLPPQNLPLASRRLREHKVATHELDLESIKAIARTALGDASGGSLRVRADIPAPLATWLLMPAGKSAFIEYENWPKVLEASFGARRFQMLNISGNDVYPQGV